MLTLPIKKKWLQMILHGVKTVDYREVKPYYTKRFEKIGLLANGEPTGNVAGIRFRNGHNDDSQMIDADVRLSLVAGNTEWDTDPKKTYYAITIGPYVYYGPRERFV